MAIKLEQQIKRYIGLSTDAKQDIPTVDLLPGASFLENDTGKIFRWDGEAWRCYEPPDDQNFTLQLILAELSQLRELVQLTVG